METLALSRGLEHTYEPGCGARPGKLSVSVSAQRACLGADRLYLPSHVNDRLAHVDTGADVGTGEHITSLDIWTHFSARLQNMGYGGTRLLTQRARFPYPIFATWLRAPKQGPRESLLPCAAAPEPRRLRRVSTSEYGVLARSTGWRLPRAWMQKRCPSSW